MVSTVSTTYELSIGTLLHTVGTYLKYLVPHIPANTIRFVTYSTGTYDTVWNQKVPTYFIYGF